MQLNETDRMALEFNRQARELLGNRVTDFVISDVIDDPNHRAFSSTFKAYDFFMVRLNYDRGNFSCCICTGGIEFGLDNSQKYWDTADFDVFLEELKQEIELRIPDKFLKAKGWL